MRKRYMVILVVAAIILAIVIWFNIPFSPIKNQFMKDVEQRGQTPMKNENSGGQTPVQTEVFTSEDFQNLPDLIQLYLKTCGYIGAEKKSVLAMEYKNVDFAQGKNGPKLKINYSQRNYADTPDRLAFIDAKMFGIPFQGYDYYMNGTGGMKGVLAKAFTLFNQTGAEMNKACLATYLAESLFLPQALLSDFITLKQLDNHTVEAHITNGKTQAGGIFHFNDSHEMICFTTTDRGQVASDGTVEYIPWSAECQDYVLYSDGIKRPTKFRAVWKYENEDFVYFDGNISSVYGAKVDW